MITIPTKTLQLVSEKKVVPFISCIGIDTASRTGIAKAVTDPDKIQITYSFVDIPTGDINFTYKRYIDYFDGFSYTGVNKIIIEDAHYSMNFKVFQKLSRFGMISYTIARQHRIPAEFVSASHARKFIGLQKVGNKKKEEVHREFRRLFGTKLSDPDIIDSIILALAGCVEE